MANEVIINCYKKASINEDLASAVLGDPSSGEVLDIATASAALTGDVCVIRAKGSGFWYKRGQSGVSATANADGNDYLAAGDVVCFEVTAGSNYIDTAADA